MSEDTSGLERIEIILPFDFADPIVGIVPMGETIAHPIPGGHPGMDLQWSPRPEGRPEIFASATGTVTRANEHAFHLVDVVTDHLNLDVQMRHEGFDKAYFTTYGGLALDFAHELGDTVQKGELLGHIDVNPYQAGFMIHWELGYYTRFSDESDANDRRVCPMTFLDEASRALLEEVWETQPADAFNDAFPYICSNIYFGRNE
jgi:murein DD-endopeptidase MepM/ murein hydrolase activator NlpD